MNQDQSLFVRVNYFRFILHSVLALLSFVLVVSCTSYHNPDINQDLTQEKWQRDVIDNADPFAKGADQWFFTGDPNKTEVANREASFSRVLSEMSVRVPDFTDIKVNGAFQVQLYSGVAHNSMVIMGPNASVRQVIVSVHRNVLYLNQADKASPSEMKNVIVRIGIVNLQNLSQQGCGTIEGMRLRGDGLCVSASKKSKGNIYLAGDIRLARVNHAGDGMVSIFGAKSNRLSLNAYGCGALNVTGDIGLQQITHTGTGDINVVGAQSEGLNIFAKGKGKVGLYGDHININEIRAKDETHVYAYSVANHTGKNLNVFTFGRARVGLAGYTDDLYVNTATSSQFFGRYLCTQDAYARARDQSHINVTARGKIFTAATQNGSIYFFGSPQLMSQFLSGNGTVIPIWSNDSNRCGVYRYRAYSHPRVYRHRNYKGEQ